MLTRIMILLLMFSGAVWLVGCNTIEGAGEDIQAVGHGVSDSASGAGDAMFGEKERE